VSIVWLRVGAYIIFFFKKKCAKIKKYKTFFESGYRDIAAQIYKVIKISVVFELSYISFCF